MGTSTGSVPYSVEALVLKACFVGFCGTASAPHVLGHVSQIDLCDILCSARMDGLLSVRLKGTRRSTAACAPSHAQMCFASGLSNQEAFENNIDDHPLALLWQSSGQVLHAGWCVRDSHNSTTSGQCLSSASCCRVLEGCVSICLRP